MHGTMHIHYKRGHRHHYHRPFWPGLLFLLLLFVIFKGFFFVLLIPVVVFAMFCLVKGFTRMMFHPAWHSHRYEDKRKNDDLIIYDKHKNDDDRRYVRTEDGDWVEIV